MLFTRIFSLHTRTHLRLLSRTIQSKSHSQIPKIPFFPNHHHFSTHNNNNNNNNNNDGNGKKPGSDLWKMSQDNYDADDIFDNHVEQLKSQSPVGGGRDDRSKSDKVGYFAEEGSWSLGEGGNEGDGPVLDEFVKKDGGGGGGNRLLNEAKGAEEWKIVGEEEGKMEEVYGIERESALSGSGVSDAVEDEKSREEREMITAAKKLQLEKEEQSLMEAIKGPDRALGDLIEASGITDAMLDSLIALKNFEDIEGLPPLTQIEDERYEKTLRKSSRYEIEIQKQEDAANARVRKVDEKGRAYGTGKRKCSIARVWIQPGEGKFCINDKEFDVYFPMLDHRAALLRPFSETKTLGLWDVKCTVKGGGVSGQVDAIRLGVSRALQNWEPGLRPPLREAGFLTRDPRVVERKKPGKAKARKSFQWVKR